jgi:hypothetical protein
MATRNQIEVKKYFTPEVKKKLNSWEKEFISSLYKKETNWSDKQVEVFEKIKIKYAIQERKVVEQIIYLPMGYAKGASTYQKVTSKKYRKNRFFTNIKKNQI